MNYLFFRSEKKKVLHTKIVCVEKLPWKIKILIFWNVSVLTCFSTGNYALKLHDRLDIILIRKKQMSDWSGLIIRINRLVRIINPD